MPLMALQEGNTCCPGVLGSLPKPSSFASQQAQIVGKKQAHTSARTSKLSSALRNPQSQGGKNRAPPYKRPQHRRRTTWPQGSQPCCMPGASAPAVGEESRTTQANTRPHSDKTRFDGSSMLDDAWGSPQWRGGHGPYICTHRENMLQHGRRLYQRRAHQAPFTHSRNISQVASTQRRRHVSSLVLSEFTLVGTQRHLTAYALPTYYGLALRIVWYLLLRALRLQNPPSRRRAPSSCASFPLPLPPQGTHSLLLLLLLLPAARAVPAAQRRRGVGAARSAFRTARPARPLAAALPPHSVRVLAPGAGRCRLPPELLLTGRPLEVHQGAHQVGGSSRLEDQPPVVRGVQHLPSEVDAHGASNAGQAVGQAIENARVLGGDVLVVAAVTCRGREGGQAGAAQQLSGQGSRGGMKGRPGGTSASMPQNRQASCASWTLDAQVGTPHSHLAGCNPRRQPWPRTLTRGSKAAERQPAHNVGHGVVDGVGARPRVPSQLEQYQGRPKAGNGLHQLAGGGTVQNLRAQPGRGRRCQGYTTWASCGKEGLEGDAWLST